MNLVSDEYIYNLMEQGQEAQVVEECAFCKADLYEGEEVLSDNEENYFCDIQCAREYHQIKDDENALQEWEESICPVCAGTVTSEYEVYINKWGEHFCSSECAEEEAGIDYIVLERY